ncbi:MAG: site-specific integrase [Pseudomonadota bacterium]
MHETGSLFTGAGERKYLTVSERDRFFAEAAKEELRFFAYCLLLSLTGCRVSEGLALIPAHVDVEECAVRFRTLKRRRGQPPKWRSVPVPTELVRLLQSLFHHRNTPLFPYHRSTIWRRVQAVMFRAGIKGAQATPKAFRHYFGVQADAHAIPQPILKRWMGHSKLESTEIYRQAVGAEEAALAARLCWLEPDQSTTMEAL